MQRLSEKARSFQVLPKPKILDVGVSHHRRRMPATDRRLLLMASLSFILRKLRHNQTVTQAELAELSTLGENAEGV
jgi:hypothetical protein